MATHLTLLNILYRKSTASGTRCAGSHLFLPLNSLLMEKHFTSMGLWTSSTVKCRGSTGRVVFSLKTLPSNGALTYSTGKSANALILGAPPCSPRGDPKAPP